MDCVQSALDSILFIEKFAPPDLALSLAASTVHRAFWEDAYNKNLRVQNVEIEFRLGRCPSNGRGPFVSSISKRQYELILAGLQAFSGWDHVEQGRQIVHYFAEVDESVRLVVHDDGAHQLVSKQKVMHADFIGTKLPFDVRMSISLELPIRGDSQFSVERASRVVHRERSSFTLNNIRYDLSKLMHSACEEYQLEIELVNLTSIQMKYDNAQKLTKEIERRLIDVVNLVEPVREYQLKLLRKRHF